MGGVNQPLGVPFIPFSSSLPFPLPPLSLSPPFLLKPGVLCESLGGINPPDGCVGNSLRERMRE